MFIPTAKKEWNKFTIVLKISYTEPNFYPLVPCYDKDIKNLEC